MSRRGLITGLISLVAAPAIVRASSLMPVKRMEPGLTVPGFWGTIDTSRLKPSDAAGCVTLNSSALYKPDGSVVGAGELRAGAVVRMLYDPATGKWTFVAQS